MIICIFYGGQLLMIHDKKNNEIDEEYIIDTCNSVLKQRYTSITYHIIYHQTKHINIL